MVDLPEVHIYFCGSSEKLYFLTKSSKLNLIEIYILSLIYNDDGTFIRF